MKVKQANYEAATTETAYCPRQHSFVATEKRMNKQEKTTTEESVKLKKTGTKCIVVAETGD